MVIAPKNSPVRAVFAACVALALLAGCNEREEAQVADADEMPPRVESAVEDPNETSPISDPAPAALVIAPMPPPPTDADTTDVPIDVIVVTPAPYLGQAVVGTAKVTEVPFDRGFWMEKNGQRMFGVIAQSPGMEEAVNIEAGQTLRLAGVVYDSALASRIAGEMDPKAMETIAGQPAFLLVDAKNISVVEPKAD